MALTTHVPTKTKASGSTKKSKSTTTKTTKEHRVALKVVVEHTEDEDLAELVTLAYELLTLIFSSGAICNSKSKSLLKKHVTFLVNIVNAPTSKAIGV
eukprot:15350572-Ditylum_brightwellii.AAC.1